MEIITWTPERVERLTQLFEERLPTIAALGRGRSETGRWYARDKALVVQQVREAPGTRSHVKELYGLSEEELQGSEALFDAGVKDTLTATKLQDYRQSEVLAELAKTKLPLGQVERCTWGTTETFPAGLKAAIGRSVRPMIDEWGGAPLDTWQMRTAMIALSLASLAAWGTVLWYVISLVEHYLL